MSRLNELIQQYCPDGVEYKPLGEVCDIKGRIGFRGYTRQDLVEEADGAITLSPSNIINQELNYEDCSYISWAKYEESPEIKVAVGDVIFTKSASVGKTALVKYLPKEATINPQLVVLKNIQCNSAFLAYVLKTYRFQKEVAKLQGVGSVPNISQTSLSGITIPIPPLPVQEEIVRILDSFTELQAELQAELQKRLQQYNYYRDNLLSFEGRTDVEWKKLGDVADLLSGFPFDSTQFTSAGIRLMRGVNIKRGQLCFNENDDRYWKSTAGLEKYIVEENDIVISMDGSLVGKSFGMVKKEHLPLLLVQRVARIRSSVFNINFIYHCIKNWFPNYVDKKKTKGAIPHISMKDIANLPLPSLSLEEQEKIATILDRFDTLTNDLSQGLPAEIEARRKQYEYYRDQLLTFKQKA